MKPLLYTIIILSTVGGCNSCGSNWTKEDAENYQNYNDSIQARYIGNWIGTSEGKINIEGRLIEKNGNSVSYHYDSGDDDYTDNERTLLDSTIIDSIFITIQDSTIEVQGIAQLEGQIFSYNNDLMSFIHLENISDAEKSNETDCTIYYWVERNDSLEMELGLNLYNDRVYKYEYKMKVIRTNMNKKTFANKT